VPKVREGHAHPLGLASQGGIANRAARAAPTENEQVGAGRPFDEAMIAGYVRAARDAHADGFLFWNPAANYGTVSRSMNGRARDLSPFPVSATELPTRREPQPTTAETPVLAVPIAAASQRVSLR